MIFKTQKKIRKHTRVVSLVPAAMLVVLLGFSLLTPAPTNAGFFRTFVNDWKSVVTTMTNKSLTLFSRTPDVTILQHNTSPTTNTTHPSNTPSTKKKNTPTPTFTQTTLPRTEPTFTTTNQPQTIPSPTNQGLISRLEALEVQIAAVLKTTAHPQNNHNDSANTSSATNTAHPSTQVPPLPLPPTIDTFSNTEQNILNTAFAHTQQSHLTLSNQITNQEKTLQSYINQQLQNTTNTISHTLIGPTNRIPTLDAVLQVGNIATKAVTFQGGVTFDSATTFSNTTIFTGSSTFDTNTLTIDATNNRVGIATTTPTDTFSLNGPAYLAQITAPTNTTNRLYNVAGALFFNGTNLSSGGGSLSSWATTTSQVTNQLINYPSNNTDIITIGNTSTTTASFWFNPNNTTAYFSGNVGIGTTTPYAKLSVAGNGVFDGNIRSSFFTATSTTATTTLAGGLNVGSGGLVYDHSTGNVGVGTANPEAMFHVNDSSGTSVKINSHSGTELLFGDGITSVRLKIQ